jgi:hypothetical protein
MNQILSTKLEKNKKKWFEFQFIFSIFFMVILIFCIFLYFNYLRKKENVSNNLIANYNIYKLYDIPQESVYQESSNNLFRNY